MASLIKVTSGKVPSRAVQFANGAGERKTIRIGKCGLEQARTFKQNVERLLACKTTGTTRELELSLWLAKLPDDMHEKVAKAGLCEPREPTGPQPTAPTLKEWCDKYIGQRKTELRPSSIVALKRTQTLLQDHIGENVGIDAVTPSQAFDWRSWLLTTKSMAEATVRQHARNAKLIFGAATDRELIVRNPFKKLPGTSIAAERSRYVRPEEVDKLLGAAPDLQYKLVFGLARLAGLRIPSEALALTWADVDFDKARLRVRCIKTERHAGKAIRMVPIVPKLLTILQDAFDAAPEGAKRVVATSRNNLVRTFQVAVKRAGIDEILRPYQTLRQSCETEWAKIYPQHAVSAWLGHSIAVSLKHYLTVDDDLFDKAAGRAAKSAAADSCTESQDVESKEAKG